MRKSAIVCALVPAGLCMLALQADQTRKAPVVWPASAIKWTDSTDVKGAKSSILWGDVKNGPYGALRKFPAGTNVALHSHTSDQKAVIVSGTIVLTLEGGSPKELGPGSYVFIPGGLKHTSECKTGADCLFFEEQPGASDIVFAQTPAPKG